jgi:curved DNA-binding protein CbpA
MSISPSPCDPYVTLGVGKDATLSEIKAAHRKLVLKCHPDKIQDESLRNRARDQFQRVQESYELLSDEKARSRYDQKVLLAELRKDMLERNAATSASSYPSRPSREFRDGRVYEERAPADASFLDDDIPYTEEPESYSRKHDDYRRPRSSRGGDDKKKPSRPATTPTVRSPKESSREFSSRSHSDRAKYRTKERRREYLDKYEHPYVDDESSDSNRSTYYVKVKRPAESRRSRDQASHRRPTEPLRRSESNRRYRDDEDYSDDYTSKHDLWHTSARDYILRSKNSPIIEVDNRSRAPRSPTSHPTTTGYESSDRDKEPSSSAAAAAASAASTRRHRHTHSKPESRTASPRRGHRQSSERLDSWPSPKDYDRSKVPPLPTNNSSPAGIKLSTSRSGTTLQPPTPSVGRSVTAPYGKVRREGSSRSEGTNNPLHNMLPVSVPDAAHSRSKVRSTDKHDSGYSSPGTPDTPQGPGVSKSNRYKIVEPPETMSVEPEPRSYLGSSPPRSSAPRSSSKVSRTAYSYSVEQLGPTRSSNKTSPSVPPRHLYGEVHYAPEIRTSDIKYGLYDKIPVVSRRQSAY